MKPRLLAALAAPLALLLTGAAPAGGSFTTNGAVIRDANGERFVMRGVNMSHAWAHQRSVRDLPAIAATGANTIRIPLGAGCKFRETPIAEVRWLITQAKAHRMVPMVEVHDATGLGEDEKACPMDVVVAYWAKIKPALDGEERFAIVNIANEPRGNNDTAKWVAEQAGAVAALRKMGYRHLLVVDGPNWGQDREHLMLTHAREVLAADPLHKLAFSVHMYGDWDSEAKVDQYFDAWADAKLPVLVGEFGDMFRGTKVPAAYIMRESAERANGYLAWSWTPNGGPDANLDLVVDSDPKRVTPWGKLVFDTFRDAEPASMFGASAKQATSSPRP